MSPGRVIVEADGGSRGNPGPAGYGALVRDAETGVVLREMAAGIGVASNNVAEYRGLIAGLEAALDLGADDVEVRMDSKLVVEQMSGRWKVKHPDMKELAAAAAAIVRALPAVRFTHVPRERNRDADRLANQAMDAQQDGREWRPAVADVADGSRPTAGNTLYGWSAPVGTPTVAMIVRHGETPLSLEKRFSGRGEAELTERGAAQAAALAKRLASTPVDAIVSSPLRRTRQTSAVIGDLLGIEVTVDDGFAETDFGEWEGFTFAEVAEHSGDLLKAWLDDPRIAPPGGESMAATAVRVAAAQERVTTAYSGKIVVVVAHVTPIKLLLRDALEAPMDAVFRLHLDPASVSMIDWYAGGASVVRLMNDTSHLGDLATPPRR
ncbi:MAG TPA: bifunctional RNase H/acid phosphatase [Mycobacteriales bacterium]|nr:bifunctional RNase H/acid phosphatase [Mycobacteriales bacterium]